MRQPNYFLLTINPIDRNEIFGKQDLEAIAETFGIEN
jgi:hypothetical protein